MELTSRRRSRWVFVLGVLLCCESPAAPPPPSGFTLSLSVPGLGDVQPWTDLQVTATARDSLGNTIPTPALKWAVGDTTVATVDRNGVLHTHGGGLTTVTASSGNVSAKAGVNVLRAKVVKLTIPDTVLTPVFSTIDVPYTATDAAGRPVTAALKIDSATGLTTASYPDGQLVATHVGVARINVSVDSITLSTTLLVTPTRVISAFPDTVGILVHGATRDLHTRAAWGHCDPALGCSQECYGPTGPCDGWGDATGEITSWSSSDPSIAVVSSTGTVTAVGAGHAIVTASIASTGATAKVEVFAYAYSPPLDFVQMVASENAACGRTSDQRVFCTTATFSPDTEAYDEYGRLYPGRYGPYIVGLHPLTADGFGTVAPTDRCMYILTAITGPHGGESPHTSYNEGRCSRVPQPVDGGHQFATVAIDMEDGSACGLDVSGDTWCWGKQPALQTNLPSLTALVPGGSSVGYCGLDTTGSALCFDIGGGVVKSSDGRQYVALSGSTPYDRSELCGIDKTGTGWCWDTVDGEHTSFEAPAQVQWPVALSSIAVGSVKCALDTNGSALCWAHAGDDPQRAAATETFTSLGVAAGEFNGPEVVCGVTTSGAITCWDVAHIETTFPGPAGTDWLRVFSGSGSKLCAVSRSGKATCWSGAAQFRQWDIPRGG